MLRPDSVVGGRYQVMRLLGEGASGRVWLVRDLKVRRRALGPQGADAGRRRHDRSRDAGVGRQGDRVCVRCAIPASPPLLK